MDDDKPDLGAAYALKTPEDSRHLYRGWAETYDADFAASMDYTYPATLAGVFAKHARPTDAPVLDVGAGTGLVGAGLAALGDWPVDGLDISPEMLGVAMGKGYYRAVHVADLSQPLHLPDAIYGGVVSAGTFTHGHVGPDAFDALLRVSRPGALFVIGINAAVYRAQGFDVKFAALAAGISEFRVIERRIYGDNAQATHEDDTAQIAIFRKV